MTDEWEGENKKTAEEASEILQSLVKNTKYVDVGLKQRIMDQMNNLEGSDADVTVLIVKNNEIRHAIKSYNYDYQQSQFVHTFLRAFIKETKHYPYNEDTVESYGLLESFIEAISEILFDTKGIEGEWKDKHTWEVYNAVYFFLQAANTGAVRSSREMKKMDAEQVNLAVTDFLKRKT